MTKAIVFLPGMMGSALFDGGTKVWPSDILNDDSSQSAAHFMKPSFPLVAGELIQDVDMQIVFGTIVIFGYTKTTKFFKNNGFAILEKKNGWIPPHGSPTDKLFFEFPYDWRLDLRDTAVNLHTFIRNTVLGFDPNIELYLVGHGMGGLLSRTFLKIHGASTPNIKKQILLATPNHGQFSAYRALKTGRSLFRMQGDMTPIRNVPRNLHLLARDLPGFYQLLPNKHYREYFDDFGTLVSVAGKHEKSIQGTYIAGHSTSTLYPNRKNKAKLYALENNTLVEDALNFHEHVLKTDSFLSGRTYAIYSTELDGLNGVDYEPASKNGLRGLGRSFQNSDGVVMERSVYDLDGLINDQNKEPRPKFTRRFSGIHHTNIHLKQLVLACVLKLIL